VERGQAPRGEAVVVEQLASDSEKASVKPLLMVAGMLVAAALGAVVTVRPPAHPTRQQQQPSVGVVVIGAQRSPAVHLHGVPSEAALHADWV
jgi:hypothetical protein